MFNNIPDLVGIFHDCLNDNSVFLAVKEYVDWVAVDTFRGLLYGISGNSFIAVLGYVAQ